MDTVGLLDRARKTYPSPVRKKDVASDAVGAGYCVGGSLMLAADDLGVKTEAGRVGYPTKDELVCFLQLVNPSLGPTQADDDADVILGFNNGGGEEKSWSAAGKALQMS